MCPTNKRPKPNRTYAIPQSIPTRWKLFFYLGYLPTPSTLNHSTKHPALARRIQAGKRKYPFTIDAIVILPDHLHTLWQLPENDHDYSNRWSRIKRYFSTGCTLIDPTRPASREHKREQAIWQRRFWEHLIRDADDWHKHMDYIHYNPVKHGYAKCAAEWPYSSFKQYMREGWYAPDWGLGEPTKLRNVDWE